MCAVVPPEGVQLHTIAGIAGHAGVMSRSGRSPGPRGPGHQRRRPMNCIRARHFTPRYLGQHEPHPPHTRLRPPNANRPHKVHQSPRTCGFAPSGRRPSKGLVCYLLTARVVVAPGCGFGRVAVTVRGAPPPTGSCFRGSKAFAAPRPPCGKERGGEGRGFVAHELPGEGGSGHTSPLAVTGGRG